MLLLPRWFFITFAAIFFTLLASVGYADERELINRLLKELHISPDGQLPLLNHAIIRAADEWVETLQNTPEEIHYLTAFSFMDAVVNQLIRRQNSGQISPSQTPIVKEKHFASPSTMKTGGAKPLSWKVRTAKSKHFASPQTMKNSAAEHLSRRAYRQLFQQLNTNNPDQTPHQNEAILYLVSLGFIAGKLPTDAPLTRQVSSILFNNLFFEFCLKRLNPRGVHIYLESIDTWESWLNSFFISSTSSIPHEDVLNLLISDYASFLIYLNALFQVIHTPENIPNQMVNEIISWNQTPNQQRWQESLYQSFLFGHLGNTGCMVEATNYLKHTCSDQFHNYQVSSAWFALNIERIHNYFVAHPNRDHSALIPGRLALDIELIPPVMYFHQQHISERLFLALISFAQAGYHTDTPTFVFLSPKSVTQQLTELQSFRYFLRPNIKADRRYSSDSPYFVFTHLPEQNARDKLAELESGSRESVQHIDASTHSVELYKGVTGQHIAASCNTIKDKLYPTFVMHDTGTKSGQYRKQDHIWFRHSSAMRVKFYEYYEFSPILPIHWAKQPQPGQGDETVICQKAIESAKQQGSENSVSELILPSSAPPKTIFYTEPSGEKLFIACPSPEHLQQQQERLFYKLSENNPCHSVNVFRDREGIEQNSKALRIGVQLPLPRPIKGEDGGILVMTIEENMSNTTLQRGFLRNPEPTKAANDFRYFLSQGDTPSSIDYSQEDFYEEDVSTSILTTSQLSSYWQELNQYLASDGLTISLTPRDGHCLIHSAAQAAGVPVDDLLLSLQENLEQTSSHLILEGDFDSAALVQNLLSNLQTHQSLPQETLQYLANILNQNFVLVYPDAQGHLQTQLYQPQENADPLPAVHIIHTGSNHFVAATEAEEGSTANSLSPDIDAETFTKPEDTSAFFWLLLSTASYFKQPSL